MMSVILNLEPLGRTTEPSREAAFIVLAAFVVSFLAIRTSARLTRSVSWWPGGVVTQSGTHVHHLVWGICLVLVSGFLAYATELPHPWWEIGAIGFGIGAGLTLDEFALWLHLEDVYWAETGRRSFDAIVVAAVFAALVVVGTTPFGLDDPGSLLGTVLTASAVLGAAILCALKGRVLLCVAGVFVPVVALIGAVRLARPGSWWARRRYTRRPHLLLRAERRFDPARRSARAGRRLAELLAGAPTARETDADS